MCIKYPFKGFIPGVVQSRKSATHEIDGYTIFGFCFFKRIQLRISFFMGPFQIKTKEHRAYRSLRTICGIEFAMIALQNVEMTWK